MLDLKGIKKSYQTGDFIQHALKGVDLTFRKNEFVAILGPSGSGKTTLLNIIGGLDRYDEGDLIINDKSTKNFKQTEWDAYRNNCVGFIFQSYNLISHISVLTNVEMSMTLSGYKRSVRKEKALDALDKVGLKEHAHKKPNQLSGGQMQRVAIARALVNNPDIILADEPTGALDSETSVQIMELIKEIAKDKLVIMVTHNPELANDYANRIVEFKDGEMINDSNPVKDIKEESGLVDIKKTSMSYLSALNLSFNNIMTKKGRTLLTAFASSIGIIGIALILALSNGFQMQIDTFERDSLSQMPIMITQQAMQMDTETMEAYQSNANLKGLDKYSDKKEVVPLADIQESSMHTNHISEEYIDYISKLDKNYIGGLSYTKATGLNVVVKNDDNTYSVAKTSERMMNSWSAFPDNVSDSKQASVVSANYDVLAGKIDTSKPGLIIMVDSQNRISKSALESLGITDEGNVSFDAIMDKKLKVVLNDDYYVDMGQFFTLNTDYDAMYNNERSITLQVQAILRGKEGKEMITSGTGVSFTNALVEEVIEKNKDSKIVTLQSEKDYNVLSGQTFDNSESSNNTKEMTLAYLGAESVPAAIYIYPKDFDSKDKILEYLDGYNEEKEESDIILYTDMAEMISSLSGDIMSAITIVLIAFSSISLVVSSIMIGIIMYISVLERTKEIGILRALGARKRDISRVFNAETMIIGLCSGGIGILVAELLTIPANMIIEDLSGLADVAQLNPVHAIILVVISVSLTLIGGLIPAKMASRKDPVIALRTE